MVDIPERPKESTKGEALPTVLSMELCNIIAPYSNMWRSWQKKKQDDVLGQGELGSMLICGWKEIECRELGEACQELLWQGVR